MKTLKTFDPELFAQFQKSKFVVGYHIGAIGNIITARKPVTINKLFDVSQTNELSLLEAAAVLHRDEIITLGKKDSPETDIPFETLDELYTTLKTEMAGTDFGANIDLVLNKIESLRPTAH